MNDDWFQSLLSISTQVMHSAFSIMFGFGFPIVDIQISDNYNREKYINSDNSCKILFVLYSCKKNHIIIKWR